MCSKVDNCSSKLESIDGELSKIEEKLSNFDECRKRTFSLLELQLESLQSVLQNGKSYSTMFTRYNKSNFCLPENLDTFKLSDSDTDIKQHTSLFVSTVKSKLSDYIKAHRDIHLPISKFGKLVDKSFVDELSHLTTYFTNHEKKESKTTKSIIKPVLKTSSLYKDSLSSKSPDDLLRWLSNNREELGDKAKQLEYCLAKLDFLSTIQKEPVDPAAVIQSARQLVPFASDYSSDFEHLMGSLVFIGRSLEDTPYADLALPTSPTKMSSESSQVNKTSEDVFMMDGEYSLSVSPVTTKHKTDGSNALTEAANLFKASCCYHLNLSDTDPLLTAFSSGCRVLTRLHSLQRAIACLSKYSSLDGDMLPIAVKLDPSAHRHNIFHCPVIKEVISESNDGSIGGGPVRLTCGHAISRDAFNSLASGDRRLDILFHFSICTV
ncbi:uncharacterized protein DC041_0001335 [Schistosoma bovis]|uniref:CTLH/CRA C-terminal to LisH motif domain-containing protein n=1 Tax=Schistosoma bovis TaxID=6184 RepID=A0A430QL57_SCHBO|nr:uncharacterized protein DC041_0001335 [Schistosoma bovis]